MFKLKYLLYALLLGFGIALNTHQYVVEQWMRFQIRNEHIVVSLTTIPQRIDLMKPMLQTILEQNVNIDAIYLNVPFRFKRDNSTYVIPEWLQNEKRVTLLRTKDYGPGTKLLGALAKAKIPENAILITLDDDIKYPNNIVLELAYKAHKHPNKVIAICGSNPEYNSDGQIVAKKSATGLKQELNNNAYATIVQGYAGVAYRRKFFNDRIFAYQDAPQECINSDDVYISFYLAQREIPRQVLHNRYISMRNIGWRNDLNLNDSALHRLTPGPAEKHRICINYLKQLDPNVNF